MVVVAAVVLGALVEVPVVLDWPPELSPHAVASSPRATSADSADQRNDLLIGDPPVE